MTQLHCTTNLAPGFFRMLSDFWRSSRGFLHVRSDCHPASVASLCLPRVLGVLHSNQNKARDNVLQCNAMRSWKTTTAAAAAEVATTAKTEMLPTCKATMEPRPNLSPQPDKLPSPSTTNHRVRAKSCILAVVQSAAGMRKGLLSSSGVSGRLPARKLSLSLHR